MLPIQIHWHYLANIWLAGHKNVLAFLFRNSARTSEVNFALIQGRFDDGSGGGGGCNVTGSSRLLTDNF